MRKIVLLFSLVLFAGFQLSAQNQRVSGTVTGPDGSPVVGLSVILPGTNMAVITGSNGEYSIDVPADASLEFSFFGMVPQTVPVQRRSVVDIVMQADTQSIEDVVVVGYGTMQKRQVTSSIQSVSGGDLPVGVGGNDISTALVGKIAGLVIQSNGSPNGEPSFQLRGLGSINASMNPLVVIDGMPGGDIRSLSPEDIKSIDVLKDASAGAIYGSRATGGVILITTTKAAASPKAKLTYRGQFEYQGTYRLPDMLNGQEYLSLGGRNDFGGETDWMQEALNDSPFSHRHSVQVQGGSESVRALLSLGYGNSSSVVNFDGRKDFNGRVNLDFKLLDGWLDLTTNVTYRHMNRDIRFSEADMEGLLRTNPTQPLMDPASQTGYNVWTGGDNTDVNKIAEMALQTRDRIDKFFRPELTAKVNILPVDGLSYTQAVAYQSFNRENREFDPSTMRDEINAKRKGTAFLETDTRQYLETSGVFTWLKNLGRHSFNATAGWSYSQTDRDRFNMRNRDFSVDAVKFWNMGNGTWYKSQTAPSGEYEMYSNKDITQRLMGYFGRLAWDMDDKYMASASMRYEGSSKLPKDNRWGIFWGVSGGWRISRESFMESVDWIDDLKLRASYGVTGNEGFGADLVTRMLQADTYWLMPNGRWAQAYGDVSNVNPNLMWEKRKEFNVGLDFSVLGDRVSGSFDYFVKTNDGMIFSVDVPQPPYVHDRVYKNIGVFQGRGWELQLNADIVRGRDWNYSTTFNIGHATTKIKTLVGDGSYMRGGWLNNWVEDLHQIEDGVTIGQFWLYEHAGFKDGRFQTTNTKGEVVFTDDATHTDRKYIGNATPNVTAGWNHSLSYKNLSIDVTLLSWLDFDIFNGNDLEYGLISVAQGNMFTSVLGKNKHITGRPAASTYFLEEGSFLKIQNLSLGYTLPLKKNSSVIESVKLFFTINNLATITGYSGMNPQLAQTGWDWVGVERKGDLYPQVRSFIIGAQLNF